MTTILEILKKISRQKNNKYLFLLLIFCFSCRPSSNKITRFYNRSISENHINYIGYNLKYILDSVLNELPLNSDTLYCLVTSEITHLTIKVDAFNRNDTIRFVYKNVDDTSDGIKSRYLANFNLIRNKFSLNKFKLNEGQLKSNIVYRFFFEDFKITYKGTDNFNQYLVIKLWKSKSVHFEFYSFFGNEIIREPNYKYSYKNNAKCRIIYLF